VSTAQAAEEPWPLTVVAVKIRAVAAEERYHRRSLPRPRHCIHRRLRCRLTWRERHVRILSLKSSSDPSHSESCGRAWAQAYTV